MLLEGGDGDEEEGAGLGRTAMKTMIIGRRRRCAPSAATMWVQRTNGGADWERVLLGEGVR